MANNPNLLVGQSVTLAPIPWLPTRSYHDQARIAALEAETSRLVGVILDRTTELARAVAKVAELERDNAVLREMVKAQAVAVKAEGRAFPSLAQINGDGVPR